MAKSKISAVIITKNEAARISDCLDSVDFCDEVIVVDSGSTDRTEEICRAKGARFFTQDWLGFGPQKQNALSRATHEWVLSIDADERVTQDLRQEILAAVSGAGHDAYTLSRKSSYCGQFIAHSGWYPDPVLRLFRRDKGRFSDDMIHERVVVSGLVGHLTATLLHYSYDDLEHVLKKINNYTTLWAQQMHGRGRRSSIILAVFKGVWAFLRTYIFRGGFLDGKRGVMLAISTSVSVYHKYAKLALLCEQQKP